MLFFYSLNLSYLISKYNFLIFLLKIIPGDLRKGVHGCISVILGGLGGF